MSVEQRLRTDLHAVGQSIHPDPWAALGEVETMATRHQHRTSIALTLAAAALIAAGVIWGPGMIDWITGQPDVAPVDEVEQDDSLPPQEPTSEWAETLGVIWPTPGPVTSELSDRYALDVMRLFIAAADDFRAAVEAAEQTGQAFPLAAPGFSLRDQAGEYPDGYLEAETVIGLQFHVHDTTSEAHSWSPDGFESTLTLPTGELADLLPHHASPADGVSYEDIVLYACDEPVQQLRETGTLEWRIVHAEITPGVTVDEVPPLRVDYSYTVTQGPPAVDGPSIPVEEWAETVGLTQPVEQALIHQDGFGVAVDELFIASGDDFRAVVAAYETGEDLRIAECMGGSDCPDPADNPLFGPGFSMRGPDEEYYAGFADAETVIGLHYVTINGSGEDVTLKPEGSTSSLSLADGHTAEWLPHNGFQPGRWSGGWHDLALYRTDAPVEQVRAAGALEWLTPPPVGAAGVAVEDWPPLRISYEY